jgi:hypothetical protein
MPSASRPAFLRRFARVKTRSHELDLGDMGTALALDETLGDKALPIDTEMDSTLRPVVPVAPWRLWLGRKLGSC